MESIWNKCCNTRTLKACGFLVAIFGTTYSMVLGGGLLPTGYIKVPYGDDECVNRELCAGNLTYPRLSCYCDILCHMFNDCCINVEHELDADTLASLPDPSQFSCENFVGNQEVDTNHNGGKLMVTKCHHQWTDNMTAYMCETPFYRSQDNIYLVTPVSSNYSDVHIVYRNIYCAYCNYEYDFLFWRHELNCKKYDPMEPWKRYTGEHDNATNPLNDVEASNGTNQQKEDIKGCELFRLHPPTLDFDHRTCPTIKPISTCNSSADQALIVNCTNSPVLYTFTAIIVSYKNVFCAECNGVTRGDLFCEFRIDDNSYQWDTLRKLVSVLDLNEWHRSAETATCSDNEAYDVLAETCREIFCVPPAVAKNSRCVNVGLDKLMTFDVLANCTWIKLKPEEYTFDTNDRVVILATNRVYNVSEYRMNHSDVLVCADDEQVCTGNVCPSKNSRKFFHFGEIEGYVSSIGMTISVIALLVTLIVYLSLPQLLNTPGKLLVSLILTLILAQLLFLFSTVFQSIPELCRLIAIGIHYFFLAAFCWMNVIAFNLWRTFSDTLVATENKSFRDLLHYQLYAYGFPLLLVSIAVALDCIPLDPAYSHLKPGYGNGMCWISSSEALLLFFVGPLAVFKLFDIVSFIFTAFHIAKAKRQGAMARQKKNACSLLINLKLSLILGLTWVFAFLGNLTNNMVMWYMFIVFNTSQGLFIAIAFLCTKRRLRSSSCGLVVGSGGWNKVVPETLLRAYLKKAKMRRTTHFFLIVASVLVHQKAVLCDNEIFTHSNDIIHTDDTTNEFKCEQRNYSKVNTEGLVGLGSRLEHCFTEDIVIDKASVVKEASLSNEETPVSSSRDSKTHHQTKTLSTRRSVPDQRRQHRSQRDLHMHRESTRLNRIEPLSRSQTRFHISRNSRDSRERRDYTSRSKLDETRHVGVVGEIERRVQVQQAEGNSRVEGQRRQTHSMHSEYLRESRNNREYGVADERRGVLPGRLGTMNVRTRRGRQADRKMNHSNRVEARTSRRNVRADNRGPDENNNNIRHRMSPERRDTQRLSSKRSGLERSTSERSIPSSRYSDADVSRTAEGSETIRILSERNNMDRRTNDRTARFDNGARLGDFNQNSDRRVNERQDTSRRRDADRRVGERMVREQRRIDRRNTDRTSMERRDNGSPSVERRTNTRSPVEKNRSVRNNEIKQRQFEILSLENIHRRNTEHNERRSTNEDRQSVENSRERSFHREDNRNAQGRSNRRKSPILYSKSTKNNVFDRRAEERWSQEVSKSTKTNVRSTSQERTRIDHTRSNGEVRSQTDRNIERLQTRRIEENRRTKERSGQQVSSMNGNIKKTREERSTKLQQKHRDNDYSEKRDHLGQDMSRRIRTEGNNSNRRTSQRNNERLATEGVDSNRGTYRRNNERLETERTESNKMAYRRNNERLETERTESNKRAYRRNNERLETERTESNKRAYRRNNERLETERTESNKRAYQQNNERLETERVESNRGTYRRDNERLAAERIESNRRTPQRNNERLETERVNSIRRSSQRNNERLAMERIDSQQINRRVTSQRPDRETERTDRRNDIRTDRRTDLRNDGIDVRTDSIIDSRVRQARTNRVEDERTLVRQATIRSVEQRRSFRSRATEKVDHRGLDVLNKVHLEILYSRRRSTEPSYRQNHSTRLSINRTTRDDTQYLKHGTTNLAMNDITISEATTNSMSDDANIRDTRNSYGAGKNVYIGLDARTNNNDGNGISRERTRETRTVARQVGTGRFDERHERAQSLHRQNDIRRSSTDLNRVVAVGKSRDRRILRVSRHDGDMKSLTWFRSTPDKRFPSVDHGTPEWSNEAVLRAIAVGFVGVLGKSIWQKQI